jgi:hypothetical protein
MSVAREALNTSVAHKPQDQSMLSAEERNSIGIAPLSFKLDYTPEPTHLTEDKINLISAFVDEQAFNATYSSIFNPYGNPAQTKQVFDQVSMILSIALDRFQLSLRDSIEFTGDPNLDLDFKQLTKFITTQVEEKYKRFNGIADFTKDILEFATIVAKELKGLLIDVINCWLKFYIREIWTMIELGVNEYPTFNLYVYTKIKKLSAHKIFRPEDELFNRFKGFVKTVSKKCGMVVLSISYDIKNKVHDFLTKMNEQLKKCELLTPYVAKLELGRLRERVKTRAEAYKKDVFLLSIANEEYMDAFFKHVYENLDNSPNIDFSDPDGEVQQNFLEPVFGLLTAPAFGKFLNTLPMEQDTDYKHSINLTVNIEFMDINGQKPILPEDELLIREFFEANPEINYRRVEKNNNLIKELCSKVIEDIRYLINEQGQVAKYVKFVGEPDYVMIRQDKDGNRTVSKDVNNTWFHMKDKITKDGMKVVGLMKRVDPSKQFTFTNATFQKMALGAGSGAVGDFLYRLVQGKEPISDISKDLAIGTGKSIAMKVLIGVAPHVALAVAAAVGIKTLNDLRTNQLMSSSSKAVLLANIFAKTGTKIGIGIGSALIGQALIPIPVLGSFLGGVVGTIASNAISDGYESMIASRLSMEVFFIYCLIRLSEMKEWGHEILPKGMLTKNIGKMKVFLEKIEPHFAINTNEDLFKSDVKLREARIMDIITDMYMNIAVTSNKKPKDKEKGKDKEKEKGKDDKKDSGEKKGGGKKKVKDIDDGEEMEVIEEKTQQAAVVIDSAFEIRWKSLIALSFISYYYFLLHVQLNNLVHNKSMTEDEKTQTLSAVESLWNVDEAIDKLVTSGCEMIDGNRTLEKVCCATEQLLEERTLVTLFVQDKKENGGKKVERSRLDPEITNRRYRGDIDAHGPKLLSRRPDEVNDEFMHVADRQLKHIGAQMIRGELSSNPTLSKDGHKGTDDPYVSKESLLMKSHQIISPTHSNVPTHKLGENPTQHKDHKTEASDHTHAADASPRINRDKLIVNSKRNLKVSSESKIHYSTLNK